MSAQVPWVRYAPDDFLVGTRQLSDAVCGIYWRACSLIYSHGGPIPLSELRRWCDSRGKRFADAVAALVETGKLIRDGEMIDNKRATKELQRAHKRATTRTQTVHKAATTVTQSDHKGGRQSNKSNGLDAQVGAENQRENRTEQIDIAKAISPPCGVVPPKKKSSEVRQGTRLAFDWQPDFDDRAYAEQRGLDPDAVGEQFRDFWHAKAGADARKRDWHAAWRVWCRNEITRKSPTRGGSPHDVLLRAAVRVAQR